MEKIALNEISIAVGQDAKGILHRVPGGPFVTSYTLTANYSASFATPLPLPDTMFQLHAWIKAVRAVGGTATLESLHDPRQT